jgi:adenylate cyclase class 2
MLEVEIKTRIDIEEIKDKLSKLGAKFIREQHQLDTYFYHPCRDFKKNDEALRVRVVADKYFLTYKGKKLDSQTKTREEIEIEVNCKIFNLLRALAFSEIRKIGKERTFYRWGNLKIFLDKVEGLGEFLEIEGDSWQSKRKIFQLLDKLDIQRNKLIRKSYLELAEETL